LIEILRLIEKKVNDEELRYSIIEIPRDKGVVIINLSAYFYIKKDGVVGDVYFEKVGQLG
jgi:hypothetical protein